MSDSLMIPTYENLALNLINKLNGNNLQKNKQYWIGIAGGPGSGKSTLANAIKDIINEYTKSDQAVVLPMDGYHYSRSELKEISKEGVYTYEELLARRGSPWTFDAVKLIKAFTKAKEDGHAILNTYSRQLSDPVQSGVELKLTHQIILCEGNYLLNWDDELWQDLRNIFDETWFISCDDFRKQRERLIKRHLETWTIEKDIMWGCNEIGASKKADANDMLNVIFVESHKKYADLIIRSL